MKKSKQTVLAVDDNEILRYSITRILSDAGYEVIEAKTGNEALELAGALPDLITLDINLPDLDGFQVCRQLKTNPATSHIPVLQISGTFVEPEHRVQCLRSGADAFLPEPVDRGELVATVEALLRITKSEKQARRQAEVATSERAEVQNLNLQLEERVRQRTAELVLKSEEIKMLNLHLMKVQDEERRRIARELHDSTGQLLTVLKLNFSALLSKEAGLTDSTKRTIAQSAEIADELATQVRTLSYLLHPPLLDDLGLSSALKWYVQGFSERSHIAVDLKVPDSFGRLTPELEIAIFRVVQECLTNVHKHSKSQTASVELSREPTQVRLCVRDGGANAVRREFVPGTGVLGMRERARQLGGEFAIHFAPSGTEVTAVFPLPQGYRN